MKKLVALAAILAAFFVSALAQEPVKPEPIKLDEVTALKIDKALTQVELKNETVGRLQAQLQILQMAIQEAKQALEDAGRDYVGLLSKRCEEEGVPCEGYFFDRGSNQLVKREESK